MGWFPARDSNNLVPPENLNFPQKLTTVGSSIIKGKRAHQTMRGTKKKPLPTVGSPGGCDTRRKSDAQILSDNAMVLGWHNGKRIKP